MTGESPNRPGIYHAKPLVVDTPDISPLSFSARQLIVPYVGCCAMRQAQAKVSSSICGKDCRRFLMGGMASHFKLWSIDSQLLKPPGTRNDCFQTNHAVLDFSVRRFSR